MTREEKWTTLMRKWRQKRRKTTRRVEQGWKGDADEIETLCGHLHHVLLLRMTMILLLPRGNEEKMELEQGNKEGLEGEEERRRRWGKTTRIPATQEVEPKEHRKMAKTEDRKETETNKE